MFRNNSLGEFPQLSRRATATYRQRDGKLVTIGPGGEAKRFLASGEEDSEPLAGLMSVEVRVWTVLGRRLLDDEPLAGEDIAFAHPRLETIAEFNRSRADWQRAPFALCNALKDELRDNLGHGSLVEIDCPRA